MRFFLQRLNTFILKNEPEKVVKNVWSASYIAVSAINFVCNNIGTGWVFLFFFFFYFLLSLYVFFCLLLYFIHAHCTKIVVYIIDNDFVVDIVVAFCLPTGWLLLYGGSCSFRTNPVVVMAGCAYPTYETYDADGSLALRMDAMWHAVLLSLLPSSVVLNCAGQTRNTHQTPQGTHPDASLSDVPVMWINISLPLARRIVMCVCYAKCKARASS